MTLIASLEGEQRPLRSDAERNRRRILVAAAELFAERGLDVGLDEIARQAGVGTGTVYRRFPDKAMLIQALFEDRVNALIELAEQASEHPDPWSGLVMLMEGISERQLADQGLKELMFGAGHADGALTDRRLELTPLLQRLVRRAQATGQVRPDLDASDLAMFQVMIHAAGAFAGGRQPQVWRRLLVLLLDGIRSSRTGPSELGTPPLALADLESLCGLSHRAPRAQTAQ